MYLYVTRHGETEWNKANRLQGWKDSKLTKRGIKDAESLGLYFKKNRIKIDYIYSSSLKRAETTSNIINKYIDAKIILDERLKEINYGMWNGMDINDLFKYYKNDYYTFINDPLNYKRQPFGENYYDVIKRIREVILELLEINKDILVVTHGITLKLIMAILLDYNLNNLKNIPIYKGCSLTKFDINNKNINLIYKGKVDYL